METTIVGLEVDHMQDLKGFGLCAERSSICTHCQANWFAAVTLGNVNAEKADLICLRYSTSLKFRTYIMLKDVAAERSGPNGL